MIYRQNRRLKAQYIFAVFLPLSALMAYRSPNMSICVDTFAYMDIFNIAINRSWTEILSFDAYKGSEFGYWLLNKTFSLVSKDYLHFQIFISTITCASIGYFIYKHIDNPILGVALYLGLGFYFVSYNISRQMLVVSIFALCLPIYTSRRNIPVAIAFSLLLSTIHTTALLFLLCPLFLIVPRAIEKFLPFILLIFAFVFKNVLQLSMVVFNKYEAYYDNTSNHEFSMGISAIVYLVFLGIAVVVFYSGKFQNQRFKLFSILSMFSMICTFLGISMNYMERVGLLFFPFVILTVVNYGIYIGNNTYRAIYYTILTISMFIFFIIRSPEYICYV